MRLLKVCAGVLSLINYRQLAAPDNLYASLHESRNSPRRRVNHSIDAVATVMKKLDQPKEADLDRKRTALCRSDSVIIVVSTPRARVIWVDLTLTAFSMLRLCRPLPLSVELFARGLQ